MEHSTTEKLRPLLQLVGRVLRLSDGLWNMLGYCNTMEELTYIQDCKRNINGFCFLNTPYYDGLF